MSATHQQTDQGCAGPSVASAAATTPEPKPYQAGTVPLRVVCSTTLQYRDTGTGPEYLCCWDTQQGMQPRSLPARHLCVSDIRVGERQAEVGVQAEEVGPPPPPSSAAKVDGVSLKFQ